MKLDIRMPEISSGEELVGSLPNPTGWRMLVMIPKLEEKTASGIMLTQDRISREESASILGYVLMQGPDVYTDARMFPGKNKWCETGDWVMFRSYAGTRFKARIDNIEHEFAILDDNAIDAVVPQPQLIKRM